MALPSGKGSSAPSAERLMRRSPAHAIGGTGPSTRPHLEGHSAAMFITFRWNLHVNRRSADNAQYFHISMRRFSTKFDPISTTLGTVLVEIVKKLTGYANFKAPLKKKKKKSSYRDKKTKYTRILQGKTNLLGPGTRCVFVTRKTLKVLGNILPSIHTGSRYCELCEFRLNVLLRQTL